MFEDEIYHDDESLENWIYDVTQQHYSFAVASERKWDNENSIIEHGTFYQLMPDYIDDGFFNWYIAKRPYNQFFTSHYVATLELVKYRNQWIKLGKPSPF